MVLILYINSNDFDTDPASNMNINLRVRRLINKYFRVFNTYWELLNLYSIFWYKLLNKTHLALKSLINFKNLIAATDSTDAINLQ